MSQAKSIKQMVILGGGYAGLLAAMRLARKSRGLSIKIILVDASETIVERIRLHQWATGQQLPRRYFRDLLNGTGVEFIKGRVIKLDAGAQLVHIDRDGERQSLKFDRLIYALGSTIDTKSVPGVAEHAYALSSLNSSIELSEKLAELARMKGRLLICGGGLTGIESATEISEKFPAIDITLATSDSFGSQLSQKGRDHLAKVFARKGIKIESQCLVKMLDGDSALLADGRRLAYDLALWAGALMVSGIARVAGIKVNEAGQIIVDNRLRSISHPAIYCAGDAATFAPTAGKPLRMSCATAMPMGAHSADNIFRELSDRPLREFSYAFLGRAISLGRREGLIQMVEEDDTPREAIITGRLGAFLKELICRYTIWSIQLEKSGLFSYRWKRAQTANIGSQPAPAGQAGWD
jgi:NADH dehydrogenase FAD-containing subunit